jgi:hypothetical protein
MPSRPWWFGHHYLRFDQQKNRGAQRRGSRVKAKNKIVLGPSGLRAQPSFEDQWHLGSIHLHQGISQAMGRNRELQVRYIL